MGSYGILGSESSKSYNPVCEPAIYPGLVQNLENGLCMYWMAELI
jgi:hypothetical protein